jgi:hypothetical protein
MSRDILSNVKLSKIINDMNFVTTSFQKYKRKNIMKNENPILPIVPRIMPMATYGQTDIDLMVNV